MTEKCNCEQALSAEDILREFVNDIKAADPDAVMEDWPDLYVTYERAKSHLSDKIELKKYLVAFAVLASQPMSYEIIEFNVLARDEDEAFDLGEEEIDERIEKLYGSTHNVAGTHRWACMEVK